MTAIDERIILTDWVAGQFDVAEIVDARGVILATIAEPLTRGFAREEGREWTGEWDMVTAVHAITLEVIDNSKGEHPYSIVWEPGRDDTSKEPVDTANWDLS